MWLNKRPPNSKRGGIKLQQHQPAPRHAKPNGNFIDMNKIPRNCKKINNKKSTTNKHGALANISQVHRIIYKWVKANRIIRFNCSLTETLHEKLIPFTNQLSGAAKHFNWSTLIPKEKCKEIRERSTERRANTARSSGDFGNVRLFLSLCFREFQSTRPFSASWFSKLRKETSS